ncbi:hypothetical protein [Teichococcus aestuarii]|uniref:hypothetical protein n=1 Tax=Teichococcus aestuarii TaxID=568898 RepID=UPI0036081D87
MTAAPVLLLCLLLLLAAAGAFAGRWPAPFGIAIARLVHGGCAAVSAGFALLAILALATGGMAPVLLPFGPPWAPLSLGLDALSAWFLLLLGRPGWPPGCSRWSARWRCRRAGCCPGRCSWPAWR